jgi:hypothetical protein
MKKFPTAPAPKENNVFPILLLLAILGALFWRSFLPGFVHFSNDGPLGQQNVAWSQLPGALNGIWADLNGIGFNAGTYSPGISSILKWLLGPVGFSKFYAPIALFILGLGAWTFFRQLKLSPLAATLGALAAVLNSTFFQDACWGVASHEIAIGMDFFALAAVVSNTAATPVLIRGVRLALAGLCVGVNVMEAADIGAMFSIFIAAYVFYKALVDEGASVPAKFARGVGNVAMIAVFAGFIATQTVLSLVGSQIQAVVGTGQEETKSAHWDWATQWSEPKKETLGLFVPGLFGYKMDTPNGMMPLVQKYYEGGVSWGGIGRTPEIDRFFDSGATGSPPSGPSDIMRFVSGQYYCGILVLLVALWTIAQSLRRRDSAFVENQRRCICFWAVVLAVSLLLSWGRFAPFNLASLYEWLYYKLPGLSTVRNPTKFLNVFSWAVVILFGYGIHALSRRYLEVPAGNSSSPSVQFKNWWAKAGGFDRKWIFACAAAIGVSLLGWLIYAAEIPALVRYLQTVGFGDKDMAAEIAAFSISQVGWFVLLLTLATGLFALVIAGVFAGSRAKMGGLLLGFLLVIDMGRAVLPYVIHQDYVQKYEVGSLNPIESFLKEKPYANRVAGLPFRAPDQLQLFDEIYRLEWTQHHYPYYNIQSLDMIQMARPPADVAAFEGALAFRGDAESAWLMLRRWQLTNTRYLLGSTVSATPGGNIDTLSLLNGALDPAQHRFRIVQRFNVAPKPGIEQPTKREELTAVPNDNGDYALFDFTGALPRAKLYSNWQVSTNDDATLKTLADKNFDPQQTVLVSTPPPVTPSTNQNSGAVDFKSYEPTKIVFDANATTPSVLLLNDKFDPNWSVTVDGKPAELLRCNFIMRGVYVTPGDHTVEFNFTLPNKPFYVTLAAIITGIVLLGLLFFLQRRNPPMAA